MSKVSKIKRIRRLKCISHIYSPLLLREYFTPWLTNSASVIARGDAVFSEMVKFAIRSHGLRFFPQNDFLITYTPTSLETISASGEVREKVFVGSVNITKESVSTFSAEAPNTTSRVFQTPCNSRSASYFFWLIFATFAISPRVSKSPWKKETNPKDKTSANTPEKA